MNKIQEIKKLKILLDEGAITTDEFELLKTNLLSDYFNKKPDSSAQNNNIIKSSDDIKTDGEKRKTKAREILENKKIKIDEPRLMKYVQLNDVQIVELLLQAGVDPNIPYYDKTQKKYFYPLIQASLLDSPTIIKLLIKYKAKVNIKDEKGNTALHFAVRYYKIQNIKALIELGSNMNAFNNSGETPYSFAQKNRDKEIIQLFLDEDLKKYGGSNVRIENKSNRGALVFSIIALISLFLPWLGAEGSSSFNDFEVNFNLDGTLGIYIWGLGASSLIFTLGGAITAYFKQSWTFVWGLFNLSNLFFYYSGINDYSFSSNLSNSYGNYHSQVNLEPQYGMFIFMISIILFFLFSFSIKKDK